LQARGGLAPPLCHVLNYEKENAASKQPQDASSDSAFANNNIADVAAVSTFIPFQRITTSASHMLDEHSRMMQQPAAFSSASRPQAHNLLLHAVTASDKIFAAKGCYATVVNYAGQAMGSNSFINVCQQHKSRLCLCNISSFCEVWCR